MAVVTTSSMSVAHRPRSLSDVVGQEHVTRVLIAALARHAVPQQSLFTGGSGLGKTTLARILAASLLCLTPHEQRDETLGPCGSCSSCTCIFSDSGTHPDLVEFDAASHGGKDEIREIAARAQLAPMVSSHRVYIIDEAHGLTGAGAQAFLKLLEEPPDHVFFMLCTTDPEKMLSTNRGRCVEFSLTYPSRAALIANLGRICRERGMQTTPAILEAVVDSSDPQLGVRGTVMALERVAPMGDDEHAALQILGQPRDEAIAKFIHAASTSRKLAWESMLDLLQDSRPLPVQRALLRRVRLDIAHALSRDSDPAGLAHLYELLARSEPTVEGLELVALLAAPAGGPGSPVQEGSSTPIDVPERAPVAPSAELPLESLSPEEQSLVARMSSSRDGDLLTFLVPPELEPEARAHADSLRSAAAHAGLKVVFRVSGNATG